jgi:hypothetical protein
MRDDDRAIVRAASAASKAADYLLAFRPDSGESIEAANTPDHLLESDRQRYGPDEPAKCRLQARPSSV